MTDPHRDNAEPPPPAATNEDRLRTLATDLPEHLRGPARSLIYESTWLQRRIAADKARLDQIRDETERTRWHHRAQRAELSGRYHIVHGGVVAAYQRLIDIENDLADMYEQAARRPDEQQRPDRATRGTARDDVIRYPPPPAPDGIDHDEPAVRATRADEHSRGGR